MSAAEPCSCDEVQRLRAENARLTGVIEGMKQGLAWLGVKLPYIPELVARQRCEAIWDQPWLHVRCELPTAHGGCHRSGLVGWL